MIYRFCVGYSYLLSVFAVQIQSIAPMENRNWPHKKVKNNNSHIRLSLFTLFIRILDNSTTNQNLTFSTFFYVGNIPPATRMGARLDAQKESVFIHNPDNIFTIIKRKK